MNQFGPKNIVEIRPSRLLGLFLCLTHLIALIVVIFFALQYPLCLILFVPLLWSWISGWSIHVTLTGGRAIERVEWGADDVWTLIERQGGQSSAKLMERNFVSPWMTLLSFSRQSGFYRHVILLADNCDADQLRRLRVRLRLYRSHSRP